VQPTADEIRLQLDRLLASEAFANADRMSGFLRYVVERALAGESNRVKEYVIGLEVFGRDEQYDPRLDSIVRVEARRLRAKVDEYYAREGYDDAVIIRMRRGSYAPTFERRQTESAVLPATERSDASPIGNRTGWRLGFGVLAVALILVALAAWRAGLWATDGRPTPAVTIAVLPFAQYSTDPADQLLAARLTDGVTSELARLGTLGVVSRTSTLQFGSARRSLREIAKALNADIVMEASVVKEGGGVRVQTRLVDAARDQKVWVQDFVGTVADLRDLERRIANAVAPAAEQARGR